MRTIEPIRISGGVPCPNCHGLGADPDIKVFMPPAPRCRVCGGLSRVRPIESTEGAYTFEDDSDDALLVRYDPARHAGRTRYLVTSVHSV